MSAELKLRFTRLDEARHRFEAVRAGGVSEALELETRSYLLHDFVHYAVEMEAGLQTGFYGQFARGGVYDDPAPGTEGGKIELVVAALQTASKGDVDAPAFVGQLKAYWAQIGGEPPVWLTPVMIAGALERLRQLQGRWRATPFGATMEIAFPIA